MNREILFRGRENEYLGFVYGLPKYDSYGEIFFITDKEGGEYEIFPETLGQYTGFTDKNDTRIFEGDTLDNGYAVQMEDGRWLARKGISVIEAEWFFNWEITGTIYD